MSNKQYKQFTINTMEDGCVVLKSLIVPVMVDLEKLKRYAIEAEELLLKYRIDGVIPAEIYDSVHDKILYQQRELLRFIADHQSSSFSYIDVRELLVKKRYIKRELKEDNNRILNELHEIRNWSFHNPQSMLTAQLEFTKKSVPEEFFINPRIKALLNPVVVYKVKSYNLKMLEGFIIHNKKRINQFEQVLQEMKDDYQEIYESLSDKPYMMPSTEITRKVKYVEHEVTNLDPKKAGSSIASLSMGIQKGKYDGTDESFKIWTT